MPKHVKCSVNEAVEYLNGFLNGLYLHILGLSVILYDLKYDL